MKHLRILSVKTVVLGVALLCACVTAASAAVVLRTAPFPSFALNSGSAFCIVRNGGTSTVGVTVKMFDNTGTVLETDAMNLLPDDADLGTAASVAASNPTWCECSVPTATTFNCSFVYNNGPINNVVPAK
jgi:hypothetical protein